jgi:outer membrane lipoprotein-sorting protein
MIELVALTQLAPYFGGISHVKRFACWAAVCALLGGVATLAHTSLAQGHALTLDAILGHLNSSAKDFHSLSADVTRTTVTVVVNDKSTENGTLLVRGDKMLYEVTAPDPRTILRNGDTFSIYTPGLKRVEEHNIGKNSDLADEFLLLGFGSTGGALQKGFDIKLVGEDKLGDKSDAELELTPKSAAMAKQFSKIQIWYDQTTWLADQQQFTETGSGDYVTVRYTKVVRNPNIPDSEFKPHWPKGTERVKE